MDIVRYALDKPVSVIVAVILVITFGMIGLNKLPVQLTPDVETPQITVQTTWGGATPYEIEKDIIEKQEEVLKGLTGLTKMESSSYNNFGEITLTFSLGTDLDDALLRVSNKLNEVSDYPENAKRPRIDASGASSSPVIWSALRPAPENEAPINHYRTFFENEIRQHLERVQGVGSLLVFGGTEDELHVELDIKKMARYNITFDQITGAITSSNSTISAGVMGVGRKNYRIRTVGQFQSPAEALDVVVYEDGMSRVYLRDIVNVSKGYAKEQGAVLHNAEQIIVVGIQKEQGANVLAMTDSVEREINRLNETILKEQGLYLEILYDERPYINTAINLVKQNVLIGGLLAITVLMTFLRSVRSTLTTAL